MSTTYAHDVINPATEQVVTTIDLVGLEETDAAIARAVEVGPAWRAVSPADRGMLLRRFADAVEATTDELAALEVANSGHTDRQRPVGGRQRRRRAALLLGRARAPLRPADPGRRRASTSPSRSRSASSSVIVPWNFPMPIAGWGFAPALAAGNTVVLKPAELTPLTAMRIGQLALDAGIPEGVFTVLPGKGSVVGERFVTHPDVRKVCFTGSTAVGQGIMRKAADQLKRVTLELGGKSANIVFADADLDTAAAARADELPRQRRPGLLRPHPDPGAAQRLRPLHGALRARPSRASSSATRATRRPRWARSCPPASATPCAASSRAPRMPATRRSTSPSAAARPRAPAGGTRRPWCCPAAPTTGCGARRSSGRSSR